MKKNISNNKIDYKSTLKKLAELVNIHFSGIKSIEKLLDGFNNNLINEKEEFYKKNLDGLIHLLEEKEVYSKLNKIEFFAIPFNQAIIDGDLDMMKVLLQIIPKKDHTKLIHTFFGLSEDNIPKEVENTYNKVKSISVMNPTSMTFSKLSMIYIHPCKTDKQFLKQFKNLPFVIAIKERNIKVLEFLFNTKTFDSKDKHLEKLIKESKNPQISKLFVQDDKKLIDQVEKITGLDSKIFHSEDDSIESAGEQGDYINTVEI